MKRFNFNITIKIAILMLILTGCGSLKQTPRDMDIELSSIQDDNTTEFIAESNNTEIKSEIQTIELNNPPVIIQPSPTPDEIKVEDTTIDEQQVVENPTYITQSTITDGMTSNEVEQIAEETNEIQEVEETNPIDPNYTQRFINSRRCSQIIDKEFLTICYDHKLKVARAVAYTLYGDLVNDLNIKKRPYFYVESLIDEMYQAKIEDYKGSGYDRGHLAPDASFDWSQESLNATYSLANIIPQVPEVNQRLWTKVESYAREKAMELFEIEVVNVMKYSKNPKYIGESHVAVSQGYYKILFNKEKIYEECFYYANDLSTDIDSDKLENHKVDCKKIDIY
jgi:endonuclease G